MVWQMSMQRDTSSEKMSIFIDDVINRVTEEYEARAGKNPARERAKTESMLKSYAQQFFGSEDFSLDNFYQLAKNAGFLFFMEKDHSCMIAKTLKSGQTTVHGDKYNWLANKAEGKDFQGIWFYEDVDRLPMFRQASFCTGNDIVVITDPLEAKWSAAWTSLLAQAPIPEQSRLFAYHRHASEKADQAKDKKEFIASCVDEEVELLAKHSYKYLLDANKNESVFGGIKFYLMQLVEKPSIATIAQMLDITDHDAKLNSNQTLVRGAQFVLDEYAKKGYHAEKLVTADLKKLQHTAEEIYFKNFTRRYKHA
jgi:hypothetical protein